MSQTIFVVVCHTGDTQFSSPGSKLISAHSTQEAARESENEHNESKEHKDTCEFYNGWTDIEPVELLD